MGKGGKHKKRLRSEKAKTKLKQKTKFLPKGLNITKVDFKVKPIVLPEQLKRKSVDDGPLSRRMLNVHELLSRLKHHNVKVKCESLGELCTIVSDHAEMIQENLALLLKSSCTLLLEADRDVRNNTIKLLEAILTNFSSDKLEPFFNILLLHLRCCMTNIDTRVQDTSLLLLDVLLKHAAALIVPYTKQLLQNFISLISVGRNDSRLLSVNVNNKLTSIKWRIKVLGRLQKILESGRDLHEAKGTHKELTFEANRTNFAPIYNNFYERPPDFDSDKNVDDSSLTDFVPVLIPLLYETWLEVAPEQKHKEESENGSTLGQDAAMILSCVTSIFHLLSEDVAKVDLDKTAECGKLLNSLLRGFPYNQTGQKVKNHTESTPVRDPKCLKENLLICAIFCATNNDLRHQHLIKQANDVIFYINRCLLNRNYVDQKNLNHLTRVVRIILIDNADGWSKKRVDLEKFLENVLHHYHYSRNDGILKTLCDVYQKPYVNGVFQYQRWLGELPEMLCRKNIDDEILDTLVDISRLRNLQFRKGIVRNLPQILEKLPSMDKRKQLKIATLFYGIGNLDKFDSFLQKNQDSSQLIADVVKSWYQLNYEPDYGSLRQKYPWLC